MHKYFSYFQSPSAAGSTTPKKKPTTLVTETPEPGKTANNGDDDEICLSASSDRKPLVPSPSANKRHRHSGEKVKTPTKSEVLAQLMVSDDDFVNTYRLPIK